MFVSWQFLLAFKTIKALYDFPTTAARMAATYGIGLIATYWLLSRLASF